MDFKCNWRKLLQFVVHLWKSLFVLNSFCLPGLEKTERHVWRLSGRSVRTVIISSTLGNPPGTSDSPPRTAVSTCWTQKTDVWKKNGGGHLFPAEGELPHCSSQPVCMSPLTPQPLFPESVLCTELSPTISSWYHSTLAALTTNSVHQTLTTELQSLFPVWHCSSYAPVSMLLWCKFWCVSLPLKLTALM